MTRPGFAAVGALFLAALGAAQDVSKDPFECARSYQAPHTLISTFQGPTYWNATAPAGFLQPQGECRPLQTRFIGTYKSFDGIVTALALWKHRYRQRAFPKLPNEHACYFQDSYDDARKLFRAAAQRAKAELHVLPLEGACWGGKCGDPCAFEGEDRLTIDVAVVRGKGAAKGKGPALLHMSGVHGVEGHAGSPVQIKYLEMLAQGTEKVPDGVTILLVHVYAPSRPRR